MGKLKILMADDEKDVLAIMSKKLLSQGYAVVQAKDGEEAWEKIQSESPDMVLLDLNMPKLNGFEVLKAMRDHPPADKWQPVIIISTRGELEDIQKGLALDAEHYITKPCTIEDVLKGIKMMAKLIPHHKTPGEMADDNIKLL
jgi:CheY-like chemotaxis protein